MSEPSAKRQEFYRRLATQGAKPLWEVLGNLIPPEPRPAAQPTLWRYADLRALLIESGEVITAQEAGRRVLILENPGLRGLSTIAGSLYAGLQLVMPGEVTSIHRHTATAIRFILESDGHGYTAVNGERAYMQPGDFIVTPCWMAHDHGNPGTKPVVWLDVLDVPMVNLFDSSFAEDVAADAPKPALRDFAHAYSVNRAELAGGEVDPRHGIRRSYDTSRGYAMPTLGAFLQLLPQGFRGGASRSTESIIYCCAEGQGRTRAGGVTLEWSEHDIFVIPSWLPVTHEAEVESVLFGISDRPAQQALGLWREA